MNKARSILKYLIGWPLSLISLLFIFKLISSNLHSLPSLSDINFLFLGIGVSLFFFYFLLRSILWNEIIKKKGNKFTFKKTAYFWEISEIKRYIPGNIWSLVSRSKNFTTENISVKDVGKGLVNEAFLIILGSFFVSFFYLFGFLKNELFGNLLLLLNLGIAILYIFSSKINLHYFFEDDYFHNFKVLAITVLTFLIFGLANYFTAVSIFYLSLQNLLDFVSLFVFAFFAGYVSFVTPMGLGVREAVTTFGLSSFIKTSNAAVISIFTRIISVFSELLYLFFIYFWNKIKNEFLDNLEAFLIKHKYEVVLVIFIGIYIAYFTVTSILRYDNFYTGRFDLGNMDQTVWNTIHGRIFQLTDPDGTEIISRLSVHADFILILISPLYLIWSNPKMLLLLQTIVLGFGAIFVYLISKDVLKNKNISLTFALAFLLSPAIEYTNLYDFHPVTLATTFLLATYYFYSKKKYLLFLLFAFLAGTTKEEVWAIIGIFGLFIFIRSLKNKVQNNLFEKIFGIIIFIFGFSFTYLLVAKIIPFVKGSDHFALSYYSDFGTSVPNVIKTILFNPIKTFSTLLEQSRIAYLTELLGPLGFLSLLFPITLIFAVPDLIIDLLSNNLQLHQIYYQYSASITPFIFISAIFGAKILQSRVKYLDFKKISIYILFTTLLSLYIVGPIPGSQKASIDMYAKQIDNRTLIENFISSIPTRYSISATNNLGSHLSRRQKIYTVPVGIDKADVILFLLNDSFAQPTLSAQKQIAEKMKNDKNYVQVYKNGEFIAFEKRNLYVQAKPKPKKGLLNLFPYSITALINRSYSKSDITIEQSEPTGGNFKSFLISYKSDGLKEYALMNVPDSQKPANGYPVVIIDHGYIQPSLYDTVTSYQSESDYFANQGFLVLKPDYRGNANSEVTDTALMRFEYPIDVLNLIASVDNINDANKNQISLWSHSMGGEVTLEVLEVASKNDDFSSKIKGAVFWAPVTDPVKWFSKNNLPKLPEAAITPYPYIQTFQILGTPEENPLLWNSLSPLNYLKNINVPILLQHGTSDTTVPYSWSVELNDELKSLNKNVNFISYPNDNHNLPLHWSEAISKDVSFFKSLIKN